MFIDDFLEEGTMNRDKEGVFSSSWMSLQLQLKGLLEGAGGEHALAFLDSLYTLNASEQRLILKIFTSALRRVQNGDVRLCTAEEQQMNEIEEALIQDITQAFNKDTLSEQSTESGKRKFSVLNGGRSEDDDHPPTPPTPPRKSGKVRALPFIA